MEKKIDNGLKELADKIPIAPTPREAKAIANTVPYIRLDNWDEEHRLSVMRTILIAKRKYSDEFRQSLLKSNGKMNIEGSIDHFWGSGVPYKIASQTDPNQLIGRNELGKMMDTLRDDLLTTSSSNDPPSKISVISPSTSLQVNNDAMGDKDTSALLTPISSPVPSTSASTPSYVNMIHKSVSGLKDTENDYELLPKHLMSVERCSKDHRSARSIKKYSSNIRSSSAFKADRRDMRQILCSWKTKGWCCVS